MLKTEEDKKNPIEEKKASFWNKGKSWISARAAWEEGAEEAAKKKPLKGLRRLPKMVGVTPDTEKNLKWKALKYMVMEDHDRVILKHTLRHPFRYGWSFLRSFFKKSSYTREGDLFYYGIESEEQFKKLLQEENTLLVVGFSYCHKPHECPSGRFTDRCISDPENPICRQCFIGKAINALPPNRVIPLAIPTVHYIGAKVFEAVHNNPDKKVIFLITACEMTLRMFADWGNMMGTKGIGIRLDGRICNTMRAFELSERGIKPGLTVVLDETQERVLEMIRLRREGPSNE